MTIQSSYKDIVVENVEGELDVHTGSGPVSVTGVTENVSIRSTYKPIHVKQVGGDLEVDGSSSAVTVSDVKQNVRIRSTYKPILVDQVGGDLEVDGSSCSVTAEEIKGNVEITNSYKYVIVRGTSGSIIVKGSSSPIEVTRIHSLPTDARVDFSTSYKTIQLTLPRDVDATIAVTAGHSKISSELPVLLIDKNEDMTQLTSGEGKTLIRLKTSGQIILKKQ